MPEVKCQVVRWVADEPQPGLVEAQLTDADGRLWSFIDKEPILCRDVVSAHTRFPVAGIIRCQVIGHQTLADGREVITIDTGHPGRRRLRRRDGLPRPGSGRFGPLIPPGAKRYRAAADQLH